MTITRKPHAWPHPRFRGYWECGIKSEGPMTWTIAKSWQEALALWLQNRVQVELLPQQVREMFKERK